jgi:hypothetical protein
LTASRNGSTSWRQANSTPRRPRGAGAPLTIGRPIGVGGHRRIALATRYPRRDQTNAHSIHKSASHTIEPAAVQRGTPLPRISRVGLQPAQSRPPNGANDKPNAQSWHRANPSTRERKGWPVVSPPQQQGSRRGCIRRPQPAPLPTPGRAATSITDSVVTPRNVVDLAAWKRLRGRPDGGQWWGGRNLWCYDEAERSRGWSA